jgi:hypothetical protein
MDIKQLSKIIPFHFRVWSGTKDKSKFTVLWYIDARDAMDLLDEVCWANRARDHKELSWNLYAWVWIYIEDRRVWRWDCWTESNNEKEKGEASDSFKRACVNWGIGRRLYTLPVMWITAQEAEDNKYRITEFVRSKFKVQLTEWYNSLQSKPNNDWK